MKKAQIKIGETIMVLFIFFILLVIGLGFYSRIESDSIKKIQDADFQKDVIKSVLAITYLPELSCTDSGGHFKEGCFDRYKLEVFSSIMNGNNPDLKFELLLTYFDLFGDSTVKVIETYPTQNEYVLFDRITNSSKSVKTSFVPVTIKDPITQKNAFAYLEIKYRR